MSESFDDAFLELLNPTVQDEAGNVIVSEITDPVYAVPGTNQQVWLNYSLMTGNPTVLNDSVTFTFEGTYLDSEKRPTVSGPKPDLPLPTLDEHRAINLLISDYTARSALAAFLRTGTFALQHPGVQQDTVNSVFDSFTSVFGPATAKINLKVTADPYQTPELSITASNTSIGIKVHLSLMNPLSATQDAIRIDSTLLVCIAPQIAAKTLKVTADTLSFAIRVDEVQYSYQ